MPRPTRKAASMTLGALVLFGAGANAQAGWLYVLGAGLVGVVVAGLIIPPLSLRKIEIARVADLVARVGDPHAVTLEIRNTSRLARGPFRGIDLFLGEHRFVVGMMAPRSTDKITYSVSPQRRGVFQEGTVELRSGAPFGVAQARRSFKTEAQTTVHPRWALLRSFPLLEAASAPLESLHERPRRGAGMDFHGLREHRPGDSLRHVHWRSSARGTALLVKEYEANLTSRLTILIDGSKVGTEPQTSFEDAATVAASLLMYALDSGHPVQMFCPRAGSVETLFEPGKRQGLDWLAEIEGDGSVGLLSLATEASPEVFRRSTCVLIFPTTQRNAEEAPKAVQTLQEKSARVIAITLPARAYSGRERNRLSAEQEESLIERLRSSWAMTYRLSGTGDSVQDIADSLRQGWPA